MALKWRGTTLTFGSQVEKLTRCRYAEGGQDIDITHSESTGVEFETGFTEKEITFTVLGSTSIRRGNSGAMTINFNDGGVIGPLDCICTAIAIGGGVQEAITSEITLKQTSGS